MTGESPDPNYLQSALIQWKMLHADFRGLGVKPGGGEPPWCFGGVMEYQTTVWGQNCSQSLMVCDVSGPVQF